MERQKKFTFEPKICKSRAKQKGEDVARSRGEDSGRKARGEPIRARKRGFWEIDVQGDSYRPGERLEETESSMHSFNEVLVKERNRKM